MQERQEHVLHSKAQIDHIVQNQKMDVDLLVLSIGSAHLTDTQQQCPSFCHEAAAQGKKVTVINFDPTFNNAAKRLCSGQPSPNLSIYYTPLAYKMFQDGFNGYTSKEFEELVIQFLTSKPKAQVVFVFHMCPAIPDVYKKLALRDDFVTHYKDRIFFIGSYYKDCSGFVYNQEYIAKHEIYKRAAYEKGLLKQENKDTEAYRNFNPDEQFKVLDMSFSSAWDSLEQYEGEKKDGCGGKTVRNDYGIDAYQEIAPQTDATIGYRFISLEYLSLHSVLQSDFDLDFLAQQRAQEIEVFRLNRDKSTVVESTNIEKISSSPNQQSENYLFNKVHLLLETTKPYADDTNGHRLDESIMDSWPELRQAAINMGLFSGNESQAVLQDLLAIELDPISPDPNAKPTPINGLMNQFKRRFVTENIIDGYEGDFIGSDKAWTPVNPVEFWLVLKYYIHQVRMQYEHFPTFRDMLPDALDPETRFEDAYPSHAGFIANVFALVLQNYVMNDIPPPKNTAASNTNPAVKSAPQTSTTSPQASDGLDATRRFSTDNTPSSKNQQSPNFAPLSVSLPSTTEEALDRFRNAYGDKLEADRNGCFGLFRKTRLNLDESLTLDAVFHHALENNGYRTRSVLIHLGWLDKRNQIHPEIQELLRESNDIQLGNK